MLRRRRLPVGADDLMIHRIQIQCHHLVAGLKISRTDLIKILPQTIHPVTVILQGADKVLFTVDLYQLFLHIACKMIDFLLHIFQRVFTLLPGKIIDHLRRCLFK